MQGVWMMLKVRMNYWLWKWKCVCSGRYERLNGGGSGRNARRKLNKPTQNLETNSRNKSKNMPFPWVSTDQYCA